MLRSRTAPERYIAVVMVVLMHILLIVIFDRSTRSFVRKASAEVVTYMVVVAPDQPLQFSSRKSVSPRVHVASVFRPIATHSESKPVSAVPEPTMESSKTSDPVDWDALANAVAKQAVKDQLSREAKRSLDSKPNAPLTSDEGVVPDMFSRGPAHSAGSVVNLGGGVFQTWIRSHCYVSSEVDVSTGKRIEYTKCLEPAVDGNGLFDHLKPEYLKKPVEDICTKNMVGCDHKK